MSKRHDSTSSSEDSDGSSSDSSQCSSSDSSSDDQRKRRMRSTVSVKRVNSKSPAARRSPGEREPAKEPRSPSTSPDRSRREAQQRSQSPIKDELDDSPKRSSRNTEQTKSKRHDSESDGSDSPRKESRSSSKRTRETRSSQSPEVQEKRARKSRNGVDSRNGDRDRSRAESDEESRRRQDGYSSRRRDYDRDDDRYSRRDYQDKQGRYRGRYDDRDRPRNDYGDRRRERYEGTDYSRNRDRRDDRSRRDEENNRNDDDKSYSRKRRGEEDPQSGTGPAVSDKDDADYLKSKRAKTGGDEELLTTRTGGAYIPPARLRMMQAQITDKSSVQFQRIAWEALKKSLNGLINKVNVSNIVFIVRELFQENIVRGRGLLTRSIIQAQAASPTFTHVYAALVAIINTKFPQIGELLLKRLALQFRKGFKRNNKDMCLSSVRFVAHLVNQQVAHEIIALEILTLLLENPTDDSVEVAVGFLKESGQKLSEVSPRGIHAIFERLRTVLHEGQIDKRTQYMVEVMFAVRKDGFKDHPAVMEELDVVDEQDQFTHMLTLDDAVSAEEMLNVFKVDPEYEDNEEKYKVLKREILEEDSSDEDGSGSCGSGSDDDSDSSEGEGEEAQVIIDQTETNMVALRRTIYLTIQSSLDFEECAHKLLKMELKPGQEVELCSMVLDCCAQQRTYEKFFGLLAQRFCMIDKKYVEPYQNMFVEQYETIHRLETNKLRNVGKFFAHLLHTDAISWEVLQHIHLNEDDTTSSSRIFIKILFQELSEYMGLPKLNDRLKDMTLQAYFEGLFPRDNPKNTRFAINFFTSIGLGGLTDELRAHLKTMPKTIMQQQQQVSSSSSSSESSSDSESSSSSDSSSSDSDSSSEEEEKRSWRKTSTAKTSKSPISEKRRKSRDSGKKQRGREGHDKHRDVRSKQRDAEDDDSDTARRKPGRHHRGDDRDGDRRDRDIRSKEHRDNDVRRDGGHRDNDRGHRDNDITETSRSRRRHDDNSFESHKETRSRRRDADDSGRRQDSQYSRHRDDSGDSRRQRDTKVKKEVVEDDDEDDMRAYKERTSRRYQEESPPGSRGREKMSRPDDSHSRPKEKKSRREKSSRNSPKRDDSKKAKSKKSRREELEERIERIDIRLERRYRKVRSEDRQSPDREKGKKERRREERYRSP